jgi:hypothetical protein
VPYEFAENEYGLDPQACSARGGGPPRKLTGIGVLDPALLPKRPPGPLPTFPTSLRFRIFAALLLAAIAARTAATLFLLFTRR